MKVEIEPNGLVTVETDAAIAGVYAIHAELADGSISDADHTALEIQAALEGSCLPVLFVRIFDSVVPCSMSRVVDSGPQIAYEFSGWLSSYGAIIIRIDANGHTCFPK